MNESIKKYENHSILRQIELMSYVSSDPNYTDRSKTESSVERAGDISGDPPINEATNSSQIESSLHKRSHSTKDQDVLEYCFYSQ
jgi:hypothetical protein